MESVTSNHTNCNTSSIPVERGSFSRHDQYQSSINLRIPTLTPSATYLCQAPTIDITTNNCSSNKLKYMKQKNTQFHLKSSVSNYQNKFKMIHSSSNYDYKLYLNRLLHSHIEFNRLFIIDFDDTLYPTSFMSKYNVQYASVLYYNIKSLIDIIISLFNKITSVNGKIVIVTNATFGWIDSILNGYFSGIIAHLFGKLTKYIKTNGIEIVSAKDEYCYKYPNKCFDGEIAKTESMKRIFTEYVQNCIPHKVPIVYCIGDGLDEFNASKIAWNDVIGYKYLSILQRVKFIKKPSIKMLMKELKTMEELINDDSNTKFIDWIVDQKYIIDYV